MTNLIKTVVPIILLLHIKAASATDSSQKNSETNIIEGKVLKNNNFVSSQLLNMIDRNQIRSAVGEGVALETQRRENLALSCPVDYYRDETSSTCRPCSSLCQGSTQKECEFYCPSEYARQKTIAEIQNKALSCKKNFYYDEQSDDCQPCSSLCRGSTLSKECQYRCPWEFARHEMESKLLPIYIVIGVISAIFAAYFLWKVIRCFRKRNKCNDTPSLPGYKSKEELSLLQSHSTLQAETTGNGVTKTYQEMNEIQPKYPQQEKSAPHTSQDTTYNEDEKRKFPPNQCPPTTEFDHHEETTTKRPR